MVPDPKYSVGDRARWTGRFDQITDRRWNEINHYWEYRFATGFGMLPGSWFAEGVIQGVL